MTRKEKFKLLRWSKSISRLKRNLFVFTWCSVLIFTISAVSVDSYSYFNAEVNAQMDLQNAVKDELVQITKGDIIYTQKDCYAELPITIKNIFDYKVIITIKGQTYELQPEAIIDIKLPIAVGCQDSGEKNIEIIGYEQYFNHLITVTVDAVKLNQCPPPSGNGQGKPGDDQGKHCGQNGRN